MPPAKKPTAQPSRAIKAARARIEKNERAIGRIAKSLDAAQKDLSAIGGSLGTGASDLRKDVAKLLRDARRDVTKMSKAVGRDLERLQKDLSAPPKARAKAKPARPRSASARAKTGAATRTRRKGA
ncbi:MAG: hypothetical protein ABSG95_12875 [Solirubrobacteraceae bacterium]|jgi:chromosome segregation ATPase